MNTRRRRDAVLARLGRDAALILPAAPELRAGRDLELRYRPDPDLFWLTGCAEPDAVAVLTPRREEAPFTLFVRPRDPDRELWTGPRAGPEAAREAYEADAAFPIAELAGRLPAMLADVERVHFRLGTGRDDVERIVRDALIAAQRGRQRTGVGPRSLVDPGAILDDLRLAKDEDEIAALREACRITAEAFRDAAAAVRPGAGEWEVEAALEAGFRRRGSDGFAFQSIVASGPNATVLHYAENSRVMAAGELLLVDAGARYRMYNGDISRTFPVSGRFSAAQRGLYDIVLRAHDAALAACAPGRTVADVHDAAARCLALGLAGLGMLEHDDPAKEDTAKALTKFFPHRTSHWLGLDVHDVGDYATGGEPRRLEPGMVLTVEPGLYIPPGSEGAPAALRGVGIRLEDAVLITAAGPDVLTAALPIQPADIEALTGG
jgi:Xaa-Pro aminopeptidase